MGHVHMHKTASLPFGGIIGLVLIYMVYRKEAKWKNRSNILVIRWMW